MTEFSIQTEYGKLIVWGSKTQAEKIVSMIGVVSKYAYSVTEYFINMEKLINKLCSYKMIIFQN